MDLDQSMCNLNCDFTYTYTYKVCQFWLRFKPEITLDEYVLKVHNVVKTILSSYVTPSWVIFSFIENK